MWCPAWNNNSGSPGKGFLLLQLDSAILMTITGIQQISISFMTICPHVPWLQHILVFYTEFFPLFRLLSARSRALLRHIQKQLMFLPYSDFCFKFTVWNVSAKFCSFGQITPSCGSTAPCSSASRLPPGGLQRVRPGHLGITRGSTLLQKSTLSAKSVNNAACSLMPLAPCL